MNRLLVVGLLALLATTVIAEDSYEFEGNVTISDPDGTLTYRSTFMIHNSLLKLVGWRSLKVAVSDNAVDVDTIGGVISYQALPFAVMAYFDLDADWDQDSFSVDAASNVMAKVYFQLAEVTPEGEEVEIYGLGGGGGQTVDWIPTAQLGGDLKYFTMTTMLHNDPANADFEVQVTWFISTQTGMINLGNTTITPRVLESVLRISNYTYVDPANHLRLKIATAEGERDVEIDGSRKEIGNGKGLKKLYARLATLCHVVPNRDSLHGNIHSVEVSDWTKNGQIRGLIASSGAKKFLDAKFGSNWESHLATIDFPAGAENIIYDPTLGAGDTKESMPNNVATTVPSLLLIVLSLFLLSSFM